MIKQIAIYKTHILLTSDVVRPWHILFIQLSRHQWIVRQPDMTIVTDYIIKLTW